MKKLTFAKTSNGKFVLRKRGILNQNNFFFEPSPESEFPISNYFHQKTGRLPKSKYSVRLRKSLSDIDKVCLNFNLSLLWQSENVSTSYSSSKKVYEGNVNGSYLLLFWEQSKRNVESLNSEEDHNFDVNSNEVSIFCDTFLDTIETLLEEIRKFIPPDENEKKLSKIHLISKDMAGIDTSPFTFPQVDVDLSLNYGSSFLDVHNTIISRLNNKKDKGLVLLHGLPGTGKTFYLKYLATQITDKKVLFLPPYMTDIITSPDMIPFLIELEDSVLFIEDAERVIMSREDGGSPGVSNILNLTDGILSDILSIQIVATFNTSTDQIDQALLRKGRLIAEHKFDKLSTEEANKVLKNLKKEYVTSVPMTLSEIYNVEDPEHVSSKKTKKNSIGFNA